MNEISVNLTQEQKDQMIAWVLESVRPMRLSSGIDSPLADPTPWWENCSEPVAARAFVAEYLPHLI